MNHSMKNHSENTRLRILNAAYEEMHQNGYQGMHIDTILNNTGFKKVRMSEEVVGVEIKWTFRSGVAIIAQTHV